MFQFMTRRSRNGFAASMIFFTLLAACMGLFSLPVAQASGSSLGITKTVDNASPNAGDVIHYVVTVSATGTATSSAVVVNDLLPSGVSFASETASTGTYNPTTGIWTVGDMSPSASQTLLIGATVDASAAGTAVTNTATASDASGATASATATVNVTSAAATPSIADLAITKTVDNAAPAEGDTIHYVITVSNLGPATSTGVDATDTLPSGLAFVSAAPSTGSYASSTGTWTIGDIASGDSQTLTLTASVNTGTASSTIANMAMVGGNASTTDPDIANNVATAAVVVQAPSCTGSCGGGTGGTPSSTPSSTADLLITKTVDNASPNAGDVIHYVVTVSATGTATSSAVVVNDLLPSGVSFASETASTGTYNPTTGIWTVGDMSPSASQTLLIGATVDASAAGTAVTNTATASDASGATASATATVNVTSAAACTGSCGGGTGGTPSSTPSSTTPTGGGNSGGFGGIGSVVSVGVPANVSSSISTNATTTATSTPEQGEVLGATTECGAYLTGYIHPDRKGLNDPAEVEKLQIFLNENLNINLPITGNYDAATIQAVDQFQVKYSADILAPWVPYGLKSATTPTGFVYKTTQWKINSLVCSSLHLPMPALP